MPALWQDEWAAHWQALVDDGAVSAASCFVHRQPARSSLGSPTGLDAEVRWAEAPSVIEGTKRAEANRWEQSSRELWDLASLAKPFTATLALVLDAEGRLELDRPVRSFQGLDSVAEDVVLEDLLRHRSGLAAWAPLYGLLEHQEVGARRVAAIDLLTQSRWWSAREPTYSDLGYMLWGLLASRELGAELFSLLERHVLRPLELDSDLVLAGSSRSKEARLCTMDGAMEGRLMEGLELAFPWPSAPRAGEAQDGNARFLGYVGHAGLYGSLRALRVLAIEWLEPSRLLDGPARDRALQPMGQGAERSSRFGLGWFLWSPESSAGERLSPRSWGHTGFAGGSLWIDPDRRTAYGVLAHRRDALASAESWRREFHQAASRPFS